MAGEPSSLRDLEEALEHWARAERGRPVQDLWPGIRSALRAAAAVGGESRLTTTVLRSAVGRAVVSAAAALAVTCLAGPWVYGAVPVLLARMVGWVAAAPAWVFSWLGGWWQGFVCRLVGGC